MLLGEDEGRCGARVGHQGEYADEIDLREYIEVLWRGKWTIVAITLCAMLVAGLVSFFVLDPVYESSTVLAVSLPEEAQTGLADSVMAGIIGGTPQAHMRLLRDPIILQRAAQALATQGVRISAEALGDKITAKPIGDAAEGDKLVEITARDKMPANARMIADTVVTEYVAFLSTLVAARLSSRTKEISEALAQQEARLADAAKRLGDLIAESGEVDFINKAIDAKSALLLNYEGEDARLTVEARATAQSLRTLESQLESIPERLSVKRSLNEGIIVTSQFKSDEATFTTEEVNPAHTSLVMEIAQKKAMLADLEERLKAGRSIIDALNAELETLRTELVENTVREQNLRDALYAAQSSYLESARQLQAVEGRQAETIVQSAVDLVVPAATPAEPSGPRRLLNIAVAGMLGVMISVFAVFLTHYWRTTAPRPGTSRQAAALD